MTDEMDRQTIDQTERESIRKKLLSYMQKIVIGVPGLAQKITAVNPGHEIELRVLQRFLTDPTRINDRSVALFHPFAETLN